jgi:hypothetical protein
MSKSDTPWCQIMASHYEDVSIWHLPNKLWSFDTCYWVVTFWHLHLRCFITTLRAQPPWTTSLVTFLSFHDSSFLSNYSIDILPLIGLYSRILDYLWIHWFSFVSPSVSWSLFQPWLYSSREAYIQAPASLVSRISIYCGLDSACCHITTTSWWNC